MPRRLRLDCAKGLGQRRLSKGYNPKPKGSVCLEAKGNIRKKRATNEQERIDSRDQGIMDEAFIMSARKHIQNLARYVSADLRKVQEQMKESIEEFQDEKGKLLMEEARRLREDMDDLNDEMQKCFDEDSNSLHTSIQLGDNSGKPREVEETKGARKRQRDKSSDGEVNNGAPMKQRKYWSKGEDVLLIFARHKCNHKKNFSWRFFTQNVPGRTSQQCYDRWHGVLNPEVKHGPWSDKEDTLLIDLQKKHGSDWSKISSFIPGRSNKRVRRRWNSKEFQRKYLMQSDENSSGKPREVEESKGAQKRQRDKSSDGEVNNGAPRKKKRGMWAKGEDVLLIVAMHHYDGKKDILWRMLKKCVPGRTSEQCYYRWHNVLNPELKRGPWSDKEDTLLIDLQKKHGSDWSKISSFIPGRSKLHVHDRWHSKIFQRKYLRDVHVLQ